MSFTEGFDAPVQYDGHTFPVLSILDYISWAEELHAQEKATKGSIIPADMAPLDRFKVLAQLAEPPEIDALAPLVMTPAGALRVVRMSLANVGKSAGDTDKIIKAIPAMYLVALAMRVSGLFRPRPPEAPPASATLGAPGAAPVTLDTPANPDDGNAPATVGGGPAPAVPFPPAPPTLAGG